MTCFFSPLKTLTNYSWSRRQQHSNCNGRIKTLTFTTVFSFPPIQAHPVAVGVARVVAEGVVPGPTVVGAAVAVIVLITDDVIGVAQLAVLSLAHILGRILSDGQRSLGGQTTDEVVLVLCKTHKILDYTSIQTSCVILE